MPNHTFHQQVIADALKRNGQPPLNNTVAAMRADGKAWANIADHVSETSGWRIGIQTLINWYPEHNRSTEELAG